LGKKIKERKEIERDKLRKEREKSGKIMGYGCFRIDMACDPLRAPVSCLPCANSISALDLNQTVMIIHHQDLIKTV
jgi:hypothetical protein